MHDSCGKQNIERRIFHPRNLNEHHGSLGNETSIGFGLGNLWRQLRGRELDLHEESYEGQACLSGCANYIVSLSALAAFIKKKNCFFGGLVKANHGAVGGAITIGSHWAKELGLERV